MDVKIEGKYMPHLSLLYSSMSEEGRLASAKQHL